LRPLFDRAIGKLVRLADRHLQAFAKKQLVEPREPLLQCRCGVSGTKLGRHARNHRSPLGLPDRGMKPGVSQDLDLALEHRDHYQDASAQLRLEQLAAEEERLRVEANLGVTPSGAEKQPRIRWEVDRCERAHRARAQDRQRMR